MTTLNLSSRTQRIIVERHEGINLAPAKISVRIVDAGPIGPPGVQGIPGENADDLIIEHINSSSPHPVYDDIPDLSTLFENGLF